MEFFRIRRDIPFMRHALVFNVISLITFLLAVASLATKGLHFSVEFTGGTVMEVSYPQAAELEKIRGTLDRLGFPDASVQNFGTSHDVLLRLPLKPGVSSAQLSENVMAALRQEAAEVELRRVEFVGPQVGKELATDGALALLFVCVGIMAWLAMRFEWRFAVSGIIANLHDVVIILGFFSFFQWEFSLPVLAAVLAVLGYSVNESVVVFDRIRENFRKYRRGEVIDILNLSINETLSRTLMTSFLTLVTVAAMAIWGGEIIHNFAIALIIGIVVGTYSSIYVASALALRLGVSRADLLLPDKEAAVDNRP